MEKSQNKKLGPATDFSTSDPEKCVKILCDNENEEFVTIPEVFKQTANLYPDRPALVYEDKLSGKLIEISFKEYLRKVEHMAKVFLKLGLERKGRVAVLAFNSSESVVSALAANFAGGQYVGIYGTNSAELCYFILKKSRANIIVVDEDVQLEKILKYRSKLPHLKAIIQTLDSAEDHEKIYKWKDLEGIDTEDVEDLYELYHNEIVPNACCVILFTSGTTGNPKGAMLSHDNIFQGVQSIADFWNLKRSRPGRIVSHLPLSHLAGSLLDIYTPITIGITVYFPDKNALKGTLLNTLKKARPTIFFTVPRLYEKFAERIQSQLDQIIGLKKILVNYAMDAVFKYHSKEIKPMLPISYLISKKLIINKIKSLIGLDQCPYFVCGSAPFSEDLLNFFMKLDILISDGYGTTENGFICLNRPKKIVSGSIGLPLAGTLMKIDNPDSDGIGEICSRGRASFMGYLDELEKTKEIFGTDNWLHTGDLGKMDENGYFYITGRIKELIITAGGENIPFLNIEAAVKAECSAISNAFLIGDKRKFLSILITLKTNVGSDGTPTDDLAPETVHLMESVGLKFTSLSEILKSGPDQKILLIIQQAIDRANSRAASNAQRIQKFRILPNDFSIPTGEFGPTLKLKRSFVIEKYKNEIDLIYKKSLKF